MPLHLSLCSELALVVHVRTTTISLGSELFEELTKAPALKCVHRVSFGGAC